MKDRPGRPRSAEDCLERVRICASVIEVYAFRYSLSVSKLNSIS
jgi:hypothetical protein